MERMLDNCDYRLLAMKPVGLWLPFGVVPWCPVTVSYQIIYVAEPAR
jgi:hypothetical protein